MTSPHAAACQQSLSKLDSLISNYEGDPSMCSTTFSLLQQARASLHSILSNCEDVEQRLSKLKEVLSRDSLPTFDRFSLLPQELQTMIWTAALPDPRMITVVAVPGDRSLYDGLWYTATTDTRSFPTPLRHTCRESRRVFQKHYPRAFFGYFPRCLAFNWKEDTLYLPDRLAMACFGGKRENIAVALQLKRHLAWRKQLQHLALGSFFSNKDHCFRLLEKLPTLKTLLLEEPVYMDQLFGRPFRGTWFQAKKEIKRRFDEIWERQIKRKVRSEKPEILWITSRKLKTKVDNETNCP